MKKNWKPTRVKIGGCTFKVKYILPGSDPDLDEGSCGAVSKLRQLILIDKTLNDQLTLLVLMHEILHAVGDAIRSNKNPFARETFTNTVSELLVQALTSAKLIVLNGKSRRCHDKPKCKM